MNANMKVSEQCRIAASKGNQVLGMIRRNITYKDKSLIMPLYKAIVRPHLEYRIQAWNPYLRKDVDMLEKMQRRATKLIPGLSDIQWSYLISNILLTSYSRLSSLLPNGSCITTLSTNSVWEDSTISNTIEALVGSNTC